MDKTRIEKEITHFWMKYYITINDQIIIMFNSGNHRCKFRSMMLFLTIVYGGILSGVAFVSGGTKGGTTYIRINDPLPPLYAQQLGEFKPLEALLDNKAREVVVYNITASTIPYYNAWDLQKHLMNPMMEENLIALNKRSMNDDDVIPKEVPGALIFLQHSPVYTLGTASNTKFIKVDTDEIQKRGIDLVRIERGGEVTYHGPGQLVTYPIINLRKAYKADIHWYMRALEEVVILALSKAGISEAYREDGLTGVFIKNKKVAAFGVKVKRWITMHGLAVNIEQESIGVDTFENIVPCGIEDKGVGFINEFLPSDKQISLGKFSFLLLEAFEEIFCSTVVTCLDFDETLSLVSSIKMKTSRK